jgi:hypothetical protein
MARKFMRIAKLSIKLRLSTAGNLVQRSLPAEFSEDATINMIFISEKQNYS